MKGTAMDIQRTIQSTTSRIGNSITFKLITVGVLVLVLLLPVSMVKGLIGERERRHDLVVDEINAKWGRAQTLSGPILSIPYKKTILLQNGKRALERRYIHLLPDMLQIEGDIAPQVRYRGIYQAVLYQTRMVVGGRFPKGIGDQHRIAAESIFWEDAFVSMGITDMVGIREPIKGTFNGKDLSLEPGVTATGVLTAGVSAPVSLGQADQGYDFRFIVDLNGSQQLFFTPVGRTTSVKIHSNWSDPSFSGAFLPVEREISPEGFTARWNVLHLNRNYPQCWVRGEPNLDDSTFGVRLFSPVDAYQKSMRTAKYALMFIVFAFMAFFISEVIHRLRVHPIQYLLIGLAIIIFYSLLLSLSEHIAFGAAYLCSSAAVLGLVTAYAQTILRNTSATVMVGGILTTLYGYLYVLLQLEDYALLMGSIGLFAVLGLGMFLTRNIDWYSLQLPAKLSESGPEPVLSSIGDPE
jgi:inner membrane protein